MQCITRDHRGFGLVSAGLVCMSLAVGAALPAIAGAGEPPATTTVTSPAAEIPGSSPRDVSAEIERIREKHALPALAGAVVTADGVQAIGASGIRAKGREEKITTKDQFHLGSCTKAMTATLIAILVEQGKLRWEMTLPEALPDLKGSMHEKYRDVTLADLLTQRSGVPADLQRDGVWGGLWAGTGDIKAKREGLAKTVLGWGPDHDKSKFIYSNTNFILAGHIAEVATGRSWEELIREFLFEPLGMTSAGFGAPGVKDAYDQPQGHRADGAAAGLGMGSDNPPALGPAGTVHASLEDWGKFVSLHLRGAKADQKVGEVTIKAETFKKLRTPVTGGGSDYAMGWIVTQRPWAKGAKGDTTAMNHGGSNTMWYCVVWAAPDAGFAVLSATNTAAVEARKACDDVAGAMIGEYTKGAK